MNFGMKIDAEIQTDPAYLKEGVVFGIERLCLAQNKSILKLFSGAEIGVIDVAYEMKCRRIRLEMGLKMHTLCSVGIRRRVGWSTNSERGSSLFPQISSIVDV